MQSSLSSPPHASSHGTPNRAAIIWAALIFATMLTWLVGERGDAGPAITALLMTIAFAKGTLIILDYMALRRAPLMWPLIALGWMLLVCSMIGLAYWKGLAA
ncbi:cytochrome C oxidase subunit IV family protein [Azoarcus sp. PA01]|nr:cytochrome C oxidase subunit IV family protein [Azoarcus sp. PA01]